jgi:hypothetical protein
MGSRSTKTGRTHPNHTSPVPCKPVLRNLHGGCGYVENRYAVCMYIYLWLDGYSAKFFDMQSYYSN